MFKNKLLLILESKINIKKFNIKKISIEIYLLTCKQFNFTRCGIKIVEWRRNEIKCNGDKVSSLYLFFRSISSNANFNCLINKSQLKFVYINF